MGGNSRGPVRRLEALVTHGLNCLVNVRLRHLNASKPIKVRICNALLLIVKVLLILLVDLIGRRLPCIPDSSEVVF